MYIFSFTIDVDSVLYSSTKKELLLEKADIVVFLVAHKEFKTLEGHDKKVILDFAGVLSS